MDDPGWRDEPILQRWGRRAAIIPLYFALFVLLLASLPIVLPVAAAIDAIRGSRWALTRCTLFFPFYFACEVVGIIVSAALWLGGLATSRRRYLDWNFRVQCCGRGRCSPEGSACSGCAST